MDDSSSRRGTTSENLCQGDEKSMVVMHDVAGPSIDPMRVATDLWLLHKKRTSTTNRGLAPCTCPGSSRRDALVASLNNATSLTTHKADRGGVRDQTSEPSQQRGLHHQGQLSCEPTTPKQLRESGPSPPQKVSLCQEDEAAAGGNCSDRRQKIFEQDCVSDCDAVQTVLEKLQEITLRDSSICGSGKNLGWQRMHSSSERVVGLDAHEMLQTLLLPRTSTTSHAHTEKGQAEVYVLEKQNGLDNFSPIALSLSFLSPARASSPSDPVHPATHKQLDVDDVVVANRPSQAKDKGTMGGLHRSSIWNLGDDVLEQNEPNVGMDLVAHQNDMGLTLDHLDDDEWSSPSSIASESSLWNCCCIDDTASTADSLVFHRRRLACKEAGRIGQAEESLIGTSIEVQMASLEDEDKTTRQQRKGN